MAAPSGTVWGSIKGSYGRIGLYISMSSTATTTDVTVQVWFWSKYTISDSSNTLYYDCESSSTVKSEATTSRGSLSVKTTVATGEGWSTTNQVLLKTYTYSFTRGTSAINRYVYAKLANIDRVGATMYVNTSFSVPKLSSYTISYNANGGSGAPSAQTKWYGKSLTLSSTKPTRTGYTFQGWSTANDSSVEYAAGASYSANAAATLYAVWKANTYTVSYNANGGTGAPGNQTKTYGTTLKLSTTKPTRANYNFLGWATSAAATSATHAAGGNYTANSAVTLYAVWELAYIKPIIYNLSATRCDADGTEKEDGLYALIAFDWETTEAAPTLLVTFVSVNGTESFNWGTLSGTSGNFSACIGTGNFAEDISYAVTVRLTDSVDYTEIPITLYGMQFPIDVKAGGDGVSFGKPAELGAADSLGGTGVADFAFDAKFNKPVYGKVAGLDRLPYIPTGANLNDYKQTGCWAIYSNSSDVQPSRADMIYCGDKLLGTDNTVPPARAGRFEVISATGEGVRAEQWSYLRQRFTPYNSTNAIWERDIARGSDNVWVYYDWWKSSLTPAASKKVYSKAAIMLGLTANSTMSVASTYTKIPFNSAVMALNDRLTLSENSVRIGADIDYIKVSANILLKCGAAGTRHFRIQKISGGTTSSIAWICVNAAAGSNTIYPFTPVIIPVKEGDLITVVYYTTDTTDFVVSGSSANGRQSYLTVEEL